MILLQKAPPCFAPSRLPYFNHDKMLWHRPQSHKAAQPRRWLPQLNKRLRTVTRALSFRPLAAQDARRTADAAGA